MNIEGAAGLFAPSISQVSWATAFFVDTDKGLKGLKGLVFTYPHIGWGRAPRMIVIEA